MNPLRPTSLLLALIAALAVAGVAPAKTSHEGWPKIDGKLNGEEITFIAGGQKYTGRVAGASMTGAGWSATRK